MVSKKLLKNKVPFSNNRKNNGSIKKKAIFVSQKVIISSIFDKSLIDPMVPVSLPDNLSIIYKDMMSDALHINEALKNKDYSFYGCNMGFVNSEQMISSKRKALVEFMMKKESTNPKRNHKLTKIHKKVKEKSKLKTKEEPMKNVREMEKTEDEKDSDLSSENNSTVRPKRKRSKPSKYKGEDSAKRKKENIVKEENQKAGEENIKIQSNEEKSKKTKKEKAEVPEVIDLIEDNSSDGDEITHKKVSITNLGSTISSQIGHKSKVYFREPLTRRPTKMVNKHLKEHTLLDKILLGINCVRKWTEKGLHLSRLCETDLALLNKRLTSLNCILTDLQEHTDENNNRYLSVLLKSDLFSSFILSCQKSYEQVVHDDLAISANVRDSTEQQETVENPSYNRPKSKFHVPSMYRQRHGLPGILSKPPVKLNDSIKLNFNEFSANSSQKQEEIPFSLGKSEEKSVSAPAIVANPNPVSMTTVSISPDIIVANEPQMTASKLLKIKSQKVINEANQNRAVSNATDISSLIKPCSTPSPRLAVMSNNVIPDKNQTFYYQTTNLAQNVPFPMYLLSNGTLLSASPNSTIHRQTRMSMPKTIHTITRIPLQNNTQNSALNFYQSKVSQMTKTANNITSKSVVLKNLLQQSNSGQIISPHPVSTNQMVPLSVFQNSQNKRPFVPVNQHLFHK